LEISFTVPVNGECLFQNHEGQRVAKSKSRVIVCGRNREKLSKVKEKFPDVTTLPCDVGDAKQREKLASEVFRRFPDLDILVNNAGIQRYIDLKKGYGELKSGEDEIAINFIAPVELTALFIGHLMKRPLAAVINVSSGLGFMPMPYTPIYSATKADFLISQSRWSRLGQPRETYP
jgi:uncharacterized oxidoreductase